VGEWVLTGASCVGHSQPYRAHSRSFVDDGPDDQATVNYMIVELVLNSGLQVDSSSRSFVVVEVQKWKREGSHQLASELSPSAAF